jgi:DNA polymerase-4
MKLSEKTGRRLRKHDYQSYGVYLGLAFQDGTWWGKSKKSDDPIYSTQEIYANLMKLFKMVNFPAPCTHVNISVFNVRPANPIQLGLFDGTRLDTKSLARAADKINDRYGEFTVVPAKMANMQQVIIKRVPFGSVRDI